MLSRLIARFAGVRAPLLITNDCLHKRHATCFGSGQGCGCYCHTASPSVLAALRDATISLQEPAFDFEHSLLGADARERKAAA